MKTNSNVSNTEIFRKIITIGFLISVLSVLSNRLHASDYYWVGDGGNWSDYGVHWATTSGGGVFHTALPSGNDNVYFDENSFSGALQGVNLNVAATCSDMSWVGSGTDMPDFGGGMDLNIYGSLQLESGMTVSLSSQVLFMSDDLGETIDMDEIGLPSVWNVIFNGDGEWTLLDSLSIPNASLQVDKGVFNSGNQLIRSTQINSWIGGIRTINLGASDVYVTWGLNLFSTAGLTFDAGTSHIYTETTSIWLSDPITFYDITFDPGFPSIINLAGQLTFNDINLAVDCDLALESGQVYTVNGTINGVGTCASLFQLSSSFPGEQTTINKTSGSLNLNFAAIADVIGVGGAAFNGINSSDLGNNIGWSISSPVALNYYWIGDGGNWSDVSKWSLSSGGPATICIPSINDNVFFDANSFSAPGEIVNVDANAYCNNMDWTGSGSDSPDLGGWNPLRLKGSLIFESGVTNSNTGTLTFISNNSETITSAGVTINAWSLVFDGGGTFTLTDELNAFQLTLNQGTLITGNNDVNINSFSTNSSSTRQFNLGSSDVNLLGNWSVVNSTGMTLNAGTSTINLTGSFSGGGLVYDDVVLTSIGNAYINDNNSFDSLILAGTGTIDFVFQDGTNQMVNYLIDEGGDCANRKKLKSSFGGIQATITDAAGTNNLDYVEIEDMVVVGGAVFNATNANDLGNNSGWNFTAGVPQTFYWIAGSGNWNDQNNWSMASGGVASGCIPSQIDDVVFDANSFSIGNETVTIDGASYCNNFDMTTAGVGLGALSNNGALNIYGDFLLHNTVDVSSYSGIINYRASSAGNLIDTYGISFQSSMYFNGSGDWSLQSDLYIPSNWSAINFEEGTLNTNNFTVTAASVISNSSLSRSLILGSSTINLLSTWNGWIINDATNFNVTPGTSIITTAASGANTFLGGDEDYNAVVLTSTSAVRIGGSNQFNSLTITSNDISFEGGSTQTFVSAAGLVIPDGTGCSDYTQLTSNGGTVSFVAPAGTFNGDYISINSINVSGGGVFNATNSIGVGDVSGWTISGFAGTDFYWIAGTGNWEDATSWSLSSGGAAATCVPSILDDVHFDVNSFSVPGQVVTIVTNGDCKNMDWTGALNSPDLAGWGILNVNGSLTYISSMSASYSGSINFISSANGNTITSVFPWSWGTVNFNGSGEYSFSDDFSASGLVNFSNGTLNTNNNTINLLSGGSFNSNSTSPRTLNLGSSTLNVDGWSISDPTGLVLNAGTSTIEMSSASWTFVGGNLIYNDVTINQNGGLLNMTGSNTFNQLLLLPGTDLVLDAWSTQTVSDLVVTGTLIGNISIQSSTIGDPATISQSTGTVCGDYLLLQDITAAGGATFITDNTVDNGSNLGWFFGPCIPTAVEEEEMVDSITAYPNPTSGVVTIDVKGNSLERILVFDMTGRRILDISAQQKTIIDLSNQTEGMYLLKAVSKNKSKMIKIVLTK
ncbi:MAG: T9SS type A sorting domain-containing protein [Flavobacteriales bacterium]|nr:T9SS type A sorting domain-containing protein [Flavobacteriales bacterium]